MRTSALTRRGFLGASAATGAAAAAPALLRPRPALGAAAAACPAATDPTTYPTAIAVSADGRRLYVADGHGTTVTEVSTRSLARGAAIDVGGAPVDIAIRGRTAAVVTGFYDRPGLTVVDLAARRVVARAKLAGDPQAVALDPRDRTAYVSCAGAAGAIVPCALSGARAGTPIAVGGQPRGIAVVPGGGHALVALNAAAAVAIVDLARRRVVRRIATAAYPERVAIAPDGRRALVSHGGFGERRVSLIDLAHDRVARRIEAGRDPFAVAFSADGAHALVADYSGAGVTMIDLASLRRRTTIVGHRPRGIAVSGRRAFVVAEYEGTVAALTLPKPRPLAHA